MKIENFILGAPDPEMAEIERVLSQHNKRVVYALGQDGQRVHPGNAYRADRTSAPVADPVCCIECSVRGITPALIVDHHRPGDPGYGRPAAEYLEASSLGQILTLLELVPSPVQRMIAAADHCLTAAYRGECPGVDPEALMRWRAESRAAFQRRPVAEVLADIERAREALRSAPRLSGIADLRGQQISELPEAAARDGVAFVASVRERDGRTKVVLQAASTEQVEAFMRGETVPGLADIYGDPARGFAGGYR